MIFFRPRESPNLLGPQSPLEFDHAGWLRGPGVVLVPAHPSWFYPELATKEGEPMGCVWHYTATKPGTAKRMAKRRTKKRKPGQRAASWHITLGSDGRIWQMVSVEAGAWHSRGRFHGLKVNRCLIGVELEGFGEIFPQPQCWAATRLVRAMADDYEMRRAEMSLKHSQFDPTRRSDPGALWSDALLPTIITNAGIAA